MEIEANGRKYEVIREFAETKTASARLKNGKIVVKLPIAADANTQFKLYATLLRRVVKALKENRLGFDTLSFADGQRLSPLGIEFVINVERSASSVSRATLNKNVILVKLAKGLPQEVENAHITSLAVRVISRALQDKVAARVAEINALYFGSKLGKVRIRNNVSKWGSYSTKTKNINLDFKLLFVPSWVMDYVIVHELAHSKVSNHSKAFWQLVASAMPKYKDAKKWLRKHEGIISAQICAGKNFLDDKATANVI